MNNEKIVVIGLGSNQGDRPRYLKAAVAQMSLRVGTLLRASSVSETEAWGFIAPPFLNQIVVMRTSLSPLDLLDTLQAIERQLGRTEKTTLIDGKPAYRNRTIDLDILDYDGIRYSDERLVLPHPRIRQRPFIQMQLSELGIII